MRVEGVAFARGQGRLADLQVLGAGEFRAGQPVIGAAFVFFLDGLGLGHESQRLGHVSSYAIRSAVSKPEGLVVDREGP